jgi:hypothetical protein
MALMPVSDAFLGVREIVHASDLIEFGLAADSSIMVNSIESDPVEHH